MADTKVTTVIVNDTKNGLTMKVGNRHCYARLTSVKVGAEYHMHLYVDWTYQEFLLQDKADALNQTFISSDDCCDCERITIKANMDGTLEVQRDPRPQFRTGSCTIQEDYTSNEVKVLKISGWKAWLHKFL